MSQNAGVWGNIRYGADKYSYKRGGIAVNAILAPAALVTAFTQNPSVGLSPSAVITIDGVDYTSYLNNIEIHLISNGNASWIKGDLLIEDIASISEHQSIISISIKYTLASGATYTAERFRGKVHDIDKNVDAPGGGYSLTAFDLGFDMSQDATKAFSPGVYTGFSALDMINQELFAWGLPAATGTFVDYTTSGLFPQNFSNAREVITAMANAKRKTSVFMLPNGQLFLTDYSSLPSSGFTFYKDQFAQKFYFDSTTRYNRVPFSGTWNYTYNDRSDQGVKGPMSHPGLNSSAIPFNVADFQALAQSIILDSKREKIDIGTSLNPFIVPGQTVTVTKKDLTTATVLITGVDEVAGWDSGFWSTWSGKVI